MVNSAESMLEPGRLPRFGRPYDWSRIDGVVQKIGGAVCEGLLSPEELSRLNDQIDAYLKAHADAAAPASGSRSYDRFLGHRTMRLHGLVEKGPSSADLI